VQGVPQFLAFSSQDLKGPFVEDELSPLPELLVVSLEDDFDL